ncbi:fungal-specific transcription factor domain-containing protein [Podospora aff. communis PSN243]|uniref:Fungal-specific transcription factor domain-containing protein n=1 Tax=Podospora aff. communis PSN243 TaxID=3040156 RepID=A0AAV9GJ31_9PEZI|nr:fungal-specific transcription factor domain-containing protein [Podospora aff. communis PSN243]
MEPNRGLRQQPGFACEECRRRKARCDRGRPKCGFCTESGTTCVIVNKRQQRGPKKGQLNAMRSQIATLQWQLNQHFEGSNPEDGGVGKARSRRSSTMRDLDLSEDRTAFPEGFHLIQTDSAEDIDPSLTYVASAAPTAAAPMGPAALPTCAGSDHADAGFAEWADTFDWQPDDLDDSLCFSDGTGLDSFARTLEGVDTSLTSPKLPLTDVMQADLDQLYFDRVHPICPIVHRGRYFASAAKERPDAARASLQGAMRGMAAAMSAQWCDHVDSICHETRLLLEANCSVRAKSKDDIPLEHIQAWLLLAHAELLRAGEQQAMLTAGRAFRLVQMARLHEIDAYEEATTQQPEGRFAEIEEKRRTFWQAFCLDRFLCLRNEWPLTLHDEMVRTRLPVPEQNFQNNQYIRVSFLHEIMMQTGPSTLSSFAECVVLAAIHGRCLTHRRANSTDRSVNPSGDFWANQERLASAAEKRIQILGSSTVGIDNDPMLLFAHILAHGAFLSLSDTARRTPGVALEQQLVSAYERRASVAALEIGRLAKAVSSLSCFKAHPFLPDLLSYAAAFLSTPSESVMGGCDVVGQILCVLKELQVVNILAREHLQTSQALQI